MTELKKETKVEEKPIPVYSSLTSNGKSLNPVFDIPCPKKFGFISKNDQSMHNYVFNHLPLDDKQKEQLLQKLQRDNLLSERTKKPPKPTRPLPKNLEEIKNPKQPVKSVTKVKPKWRSSATTTRNSSLTALRRARRS